MRKNHGHLTLLAASALIAISTRVAPCQCMFSPSAVVPIRAAATEQMPAYEVATIKPSNGKDFAMPLRFFIDEAFGIPPNITARIAGPDWISNTRFVIQSKPSDAIRDAMQNMAPAERSRENGLMMQSLLADRFAFKAHFETRELPVYELVLAKGGPKLVKNSDPTKARFGVGASMFRAAAVSIQVLIGVLECNSDIGGREVVDKTGLTGTYDISLKWAPLQTAPAAGESAGAPSSDEGPSLFTAIEEQLGLKLLPAKAPSEVLVIDRIEHPTPN
ncbi:MAG TPA: TIGR03435 family protein [Acidobacteriaceae bacterium]|nr:TIGR03435 family protein [Acidobacteriaceae bacterium]